MEELGTTDFVGIAHLSEICGMMKPYICIC